MFLDTEMVLVLEDSINAKLVTMKTFTKEPLLLWRFTRSNLPSILKGIFQRQCLLIIQFYFQKKSDVCRYFDSVLIEERNEREGECCES